MITIKNEKNETVEYEYHLKDEFGFREKALMISFIERQVMEVEAAGINANDYADEIGLAAFLLAMNEDEETKVELADVVDQYLGTSIMAEVGKHYPHYGACNVREIVKRESPVKHSEKLSKKVNDFLNALGTIANMGEEEQQKFIEKITGIIGGIANTDNAAE